MQGPGMLWGPKQSLPASFWSQRRSASNSWAGPSGGQRLSCPGPAASPALPALARRPPTKTLCGSLSTRGSFPPLPALLPQQGDVATTAFLVCKGWKPGQAHLQLQGLRWLLASGAGFPSFITSDRARAPARPQERPSPRVRRKILAQQARQQLLSTS